MSDNKKITVVTLAFMAFSTVWGFGNVLNGFIYFNGIQVILSWVMMFVLYFIPYSLMVGELGSAFKNSGGGVNSWVYDTIGPKVAYYAGWTYWACHITYIASKGSGSLKALSWAIFRNAETYDTFPTIGVQMATLGVFLIGCFIASKGMNPLKKLLSLAGTSMFVMSILYIIMMLAAPAINPGAAAVLQQLTRLNSVCMPLRYAWVFVAYIALRKAYDRIPAEYRFVKNQKIAYFFGGWCLFVTLICCIMGMYNKDPFTFAMNVITPVVLNALGIIMPKLAERERAKESGK